jgi:hypothetical protein
MRVPAVVGSWPEPFAQASAGSDHEPVHVVCLHGGGACDSAAAALDDAGVRAVELDRSAPATDPVALRLLVGPWAEVRDDVVVDQLRGGPSANGVFAAFKGAAGGGYRLIGLDATGSPARDLGPEAGLVAALRHGDDAPTWIVTGSNETAVRRAAGLLDDGALRDRYAVAEPPAGGPVALPLPRGEGT